MASQTKQHQFAFPSPVLSAKLESYTWDGPAPGSGQAVPACVREGCDDISRLRQTQNKHHPLKQVWLNSSLCREPVSTF